MKTIIILNINVDIEEKLRICPATQFSKKVNPTKYLQNTQKYEIEEIKTKIKKMKKKKLKKTKSLTNINKKRKK